MISLSVPATLDYRDVAVRVVGAACKLFKARLVAVVGEDAEKMLGARPSVGAGSDLADEEVSQVVSAFGEAFNNLVLHGYKGLAPGRIAIEVAIATGADGAEEAVEIRIEDTGHAFDPAGHMDAPEELPERGMGLFIMRSFLDEIRYAAGPPNRMILVKRFARSA